MNSFSLPHQTNNEYAKSSKLQVVEIPNQLQLYQKQAPFICFQFCRELQGEIDRENFIEIDEIKPYLIDKSIVQFQKSKIQQAIEHDLFGALQGVIVSIKYFKRPRNTWSNLPDILCVDTNSKAYLLDKNTIVIKIMIRESVNVTQQDLIEFSQRYQMNFQQQPNQVDPGMDYIFQKFQPAINYNQSSPVQMEEGGPNSNGNGNEAIEEMKAHISFLEKEVTFLKDKYEQFEKRLQKMESQPTLPQQNLSEIEEHKQDLIQLMAQPSLNQTGSIQSVINSQQNPLDKTKIANFNFESNVRLVCHSCHSQLEYNHQHSGQSQSQNMQIYQKYGSYNKKNDESQHHEIEERSESMSSSQDQDITNIMSSSLKVGTQKLSKFSHKARSTQHNTPFIEQNMIKKESLHMAFLYSQPLMRKDKQKDVPFSDPLDTEKEFQHLCLYLSTHNPNKKFYVKREAATRSSLSQIIQDQPTILHISCHGLPSDKDRSTYSLAFESTNDRGFLELFGEKELRTLLNLDDQNKRDYLSDESIFKFPFKLVFVSACFSEPIALLFKKANVPIVIAVNQATPITENFARFFTQNFYDSLIKGNTPKDAFERAKNSVDGIDKDKFCCCCFHDHDKACKYFEYFEKNQLDKYCLLHTPKCKCEKRYEGYHKPNCEFLSKFKTALNLPNPNGKDLNAKQELLCCCKTSFPHNENQKIMIVKRPPFVRLTQAQINEYPEQQRDKVRQTEDQREEIDKLLCQRDEQYLDMPVFENLKDKKTGGGVFIRENHMHEAIRLPDVMDDLEVVTRNQEVYQIVNQIDIIKEDNRTKVVHIYGIEGVGKTAIARYSAKFALNRKIFQQGVFYVSLLNKTEKHSFIETLYERLNLSIKGAYSLEDISMTRALDKLKKTIGNQAILIIIDNCKQIIQENRQDFNIILKELAESTVFLRFIVISENIDDLDQKINYFRIQIKELTPNQAAQVMWYACKDLLKLQSYNDAQDLSKHSIFKIQKTFKPYQIIQIAQHLKEGLSLDQILQKKALAEINQRKIEGKNNNAAPSDNLFCSLTNLTLRKVESSYEKQFQIFYILSHFQQGLFESDIDFIAQQLQPQIPNWRDFMSQICQEPHYSNELDVNKNDEISSKTPQFSLVHRFKYGELNDYLYCSIPKYSNYIKNEWLDESSNQSQKIFAQCLGYSAKISRQILRGIKYQANVGMDIQILSSIIDAGIWGEEGTTKQLSLRQEEIDEITRYFKVNSAEVKFREIQGNFLHFLNLQYLNSYITLFNYYSDYAKIIRELCINTASIYLNFDKILDAQSILKKGKQIAEKFSDKYFKALIILVEVSCAIRQGQNHKVIKDMLKEPLATFEANKIQDGIADVQFIKGMQLVKYYLTQYKRMIGLTQNHHNQFSRQHSFDDNSFESSFSFFTPHLRHETSFTPKLDSSNSIEQDILFKNEISQNIQKALNFLRLALKKYNKCSNKYGIGKTCLALARFYIKIISETRIVVIHDSDDTKFMLCQAVEQFKLLKMEALEAKTLKTQAVFEIKINQNPEYFRAKDKIEQAKAIAERIQDRKNAQKYTEILNEILQKIHIKASNVFIFAKAFPLVEVKGRDHLLVGSITRHVNSFRNRVLEGFRNQNKVVNVKFDSLTREVLTFIKNFGCRVLHLSSDVFKPDHLCIEGTNGKIEYIHIVDLKTLLKPSDGRNLNVNLVVLAIPESKHLAQVFVDLGVQHVVAFDFITPIGVENVSYLQQRYDQIYFICEKFYNNIVCEQTVRVALENAEEQFDKVEKIRIKREYLQCRRDKQDSQNCEDSEIEDYMSIFEGKPILLPENAKKNHYKHIFKLQSRQEKKHLKKGQLLDSSKRRGPTNIIDLRQLTPYTGRQKETFNAIEKIKDTLINIVNYCGPSGIGKTRFLIETGYFFLSRFDFSDGIYYLDLKNIKSVHQLIIKLQEMKITEKDVVDDLQNKNILLLLDNIDGILKHDIHQLKWFFIQVFAKTKKLRILVTSKQKMDHKEFSDEPKVNQIIFTSLLGPLTDIESADMILSYVQYEPVRNITKSEFQLGSESIQEKQRSIHLQLQLEHKVKACYGFPKYLHKFADILKKKKFDKINIIEYIPESDQKKEVMRNWKAINEENKSEPQALKVTKETTPEQQGKDQKKKKKNIQKDSKKVEKDMKYKIPHSSDSLNGYDQEEGKFIKSQKNSYQKKGAHGVQIMLQQITKEKNNNMNAAEIIEEEKQDKQLNRELDNDFSDESAEYSNSKFYNRSQFQLIHKTQNKERSSHYELNESQNSCEYMDDESIQRVEKLNLRRIPSNQSTASIYSNIAGENLSLGRQTSYTPNSQESSDSERQSSTNMSLHSIKSLEEQRSTYASKNSGGGKTQKKNKQKSSRKTSSHNDEKFKSKSKNQLHENCQNKARGQNLADIVTTEQVDEESESSCKEEKLSDDKEYCSRQQQADDDEYKNNQEFEEKDEKNVSKLVIKKSKTIPPQQHQNQQTRKAAKKARHLEKQQSITQKYYDDGRYFQMNQQPIEEVNIKPQIKKSHFQQQESLFNKKIASQSFSSKSYDEEENGQNESAEEFKEVVSPSSNNQ